VHQLEIKVLATFVCLFFVDLNAKCKILIVLFLHI